MMIKETCNGQTERDQFLPLKKRKVLLKSFLQDLFFLDLSADGARAPAGFFPTLLLQQRNQWTHIHSPLLGVTGD